MSVRNMRIRTAASGLLISVSLLSGLQAYSGETSQSKSDQRHCGAASPLLLSLGDAYFNVADTRAEKWLSREAVERNELLSRLNTMHVTDGSGVRVHCTGSADQVRARLRTVSLEDIESRQTRYADVENAISITAYEYDRALRRLIRETVTIPARPQDVVHLVDQTLETSSRHRKATRIGSYLEETRITASIENNTITIDQSVYVNGTLAQWHTWTLFD